MANLNDTLQAHEVRDNFYQVLEEVDSKLRQFTITLRGRTKAVIMSAEEFKGWAETVELMADRKTVKRIREAEKALDEGYGVAWDETKKQLGW